MAQRQSGTEEEKPTKQHPADVYEGDRVLLGINWHGDANAGFYHSGLFQSVVEGTVVDAPDPESITREAVSEGKRPMADYVVETDDGERFNWNVDNGYVLGYHPDLDRRTDVGKFGGFYEAE